MDEEINYTDRHNDVSDTDSEIDQRASGTQKGRRNIRNIKELEELNFDTRLANQNEKERIQRINAREKKFNYILNDQELEDQLILDYDFENNVPLVVVNKSLATKLKKHQKEGVKFMWNACYESLEEIKKSNGSGCILAHCMGLGKTLQVITLVHTLLFHKETRTKNILICCPKNTLLNWINEFQTWITSNLGHINIFNPTRYDNNSMRLNELIKWQTNGGVCVLNYELLRIVLEDDVKNTKQLYLKERKKFKECLWDPGPDLVICDEGHVLKNEETKLSKIMSKIRTLRRIVLTGTPMQNNLKEYHCMIQFVKPYLLGTRNEFTNMFVNPILNGQYENSLFQDVQLMKERSHILYKKLSGCVQRFDILTLKKFLPEKQEYVIFVTLTQCQIKMYECYLRNYSSKVDWKTQNVALFSDYQSLHRIWTHPYTLQLHWKKHKESGKKVKIVKRKKKKLMTINDDESSESDNSFRNYPLSWWIQFVSSDDIEDATKSGKLVVFLKILKECEDANEKLLLFSSSLYSLKMIEYFLKKINNSEFENPCLCDMTSTWEIEQDYLILTGDTSSEDRNKYCQNFNNIQDTRLRLFLISTKAGGMGINLTAANRAVIFDVSWNPSHDIQSIFRIYRIGQIKPCFIYRLVASGTMEEKMYERQVAKQSISYRVVDEKQIARHYTEKELLELYQFEPQKISRKQIIEPKDSLLQKIFRERLDIINGIHEHDSLLEHKEEEELLEHQKNNAWTAYNTINNFEDLPEDEKEMLQNLTPESFDPAYLEIILKKKFQETTNENIIYMMKALQPRIEEILKRPDFIDVMKKVAIRNHAKRTTEVTSKRKNINRPNATILLGSSAEKLPDITEDSNKSDLENSSESDDSVFLFKIGKKKCKKARRKGRIKPLKFWGVRNGKAFGSPEKNSD